MCCQTVFMFLQEQVNKKERMQRYGTAKTYANAYHRFRDFRNNADLTFDELTPDLIEAYEAWLTHRELKRNTIRFYLRTLHTLINKAHDEGLISSPLLFSKVKLAYVKTRKRAISENELKALIRLPLPLGSPLAFARDIFLFSFYMRGMPFVDIAYLKKRICATDNWHIAVKNEPASNRGMGKGAAKHHRPLCTPHPK